MRMFAMMGLAVTGAIIFGLGVRSIRTDGWGAPVLGGLLSLTGLSGLLPIPSEWRLAGVVGIGISGALVVLNPPSALRRVRREAVLLFASVAAFSAGIWLGSGMWWRVSFLGVFVVLQIVYLSLMIRRAVRSWPTSLVEPTGD